MPEIVSAEAGKFTKILARHHAMKHFQLPKG